MSLPARCLLALLLALALAACGADTEPAIDGKRGKTIMRASQPADGKPGYCNVMTGTVVVGLSGAVEQHTVGIVISKDSGLLGLERKQVTVTQFRTHDIKQPAKSGPVQASIANARGGLIVRPAELVTGAARGEYKDSAANITPETAARLGMLVARGETLRLTVRYPDEAVQTLLLGTPLPPDKLKDYLACLRDKGFDTGKE